MDIITEINSILNNKERLGDEKMLEMKRQPISGTMIQSIQIELSQLKNISLYTMMRLYSNKTNTIDLVTILITKDNSIIVVGLLTATENNIVTRNADIIQQFSIGVKEYLKELYNLNSCFTSLQHNVFITASPNLNYDTTIYNKLFYTHKNTYVKHIPILMNDKINNCIQGSINDIYQGNVYLYNVEWNRILMSSVVFIEQVDQLDVHKLEISDLLLTYMLCVYNTREYLDSIRLNSLNISLEARKRFKS